MVKTYIYPDGGQSVHEPTDGYKFTHHKNGTEIDEYMWDGFNQQWHLICSYVNINIRLNEVIEFLPLTITLDDIVKCECGAKHTSFPKKHLHFCPKHEDNL